GSTALSRFFSALWWLWAFSFLYFTRCRHLSFFDLNPYVHSGLGMIANSGLIISKNMLSL
ncbi:hypothetical protein NDA07_07225, partial [Microcoleus vaginatus DQ-U2]